MQTIQLQIEDSKVETFINIIENLKDGIVKNFSLQSKTLEHIKNEQFEKDRDYFHKCLEDIESGNVALISHNKTWDMIEKHTQQ